MDNIILISEQASDHAAITVIVLVTLGTSAGRFMENQQIGNLEKRMMDVHTKLNPTKTTMATLVILFHSARNRLNNSVISSISHMSIFLKPIPLSAPLLGHAQWLNLVNFTQPYILSLILRTLGSLIQEPPIIWQVVLNFFCSYVLCSNNTTVKIADGSSTPVAGIGNIRLSQSYP